MEPGNRDRRRRNRIAMAVAMALAMAVATAGTALAGPKFTFDEGRRTLEITQTYQVWGVGTMDPEGNPAPDPRGDLYLRRARLGVRGQAWPRLDYLVWFAYDNVGKDPYTGTLGTPQPMGNTTFQVWDAYLMYRFDPAWASLSIGLLRPQTGRELTTSFTAVPSLEYALTHYYLRDHLHTRPSGRETGLNLGGYRADSARGWAFGYNVGIFDAAQEKVTGTASGSLKWSPLVTGRLSATLGTPENSDYKLSADLNSFGKRRGITLGGFATWQGQVDERFDSTQANPYVGGFEANSAYGADLLANWGFLELDAEVDLLYREFTDAFTALYQAKGGNPAYVSSPDYLDRVWHVRGGYSIPVFTGQFLEPTLLYTRFDGDSGSPLNTDGEDQVFDAGLNWYVQKNSLKISLHYVWQDGEPRSLFTQGPNARKEWKQRNDYLALGLLASF